MSSVKRIDPIGAVLAIGIPLVAAAVTIALTAMWQDRLPAQIATHWGAGAEPDGFSGVWSNTAMMSAVILAVGGGCGLIAAFAAVQLMLRRVMLVIGLTTTGLLFTLNTAMMASQLGAQDPTTARLPVWAIGFGVLIGLFVGLLGARVLLDLRPRVAASARPDADLPRSSDAPLHVEFTLGVRRQWLWLICGLTAAGAVATCVAVGSLWPLPLFAPIPLLLFAFSRFHVEAGEDGVRVRSLGAEMLSYELSEIEGARVITVHPFLDFGGWGVRFKGKGRYGVVTEKGPAAQIAMAGGDVLTITTARAEELAGVLNSLADRR